MPREFKETIPLGNGYYSLGSCYKLHKRVEEGINLLDFLQQPPHSENKEEAKRNERENHKAEKELEDIVFDIITAFGFYVPILKIKEGE
jgi:hypothetical protein